MRYLSVYIFLGLLVLSYVVMGLHSKTLQTNRNINDFLQSKKKNYNQSEQLRCSIETPTTQRMVEIPRTDPHGGIGQPVTGQPPSQFQNFDPHNREPEETKIFQNGSTKCFDCETQAYQRPVSYGSRDYTFNNPSKCFDCEKQVKQCNMRPMY
jgi:hypothetical protein